ncbi:DNA-3-methyladenine glycosylase 2 family protein [bacterium]|nr:MAG: DNA-3-methyladenine glycosylase 2 family protein [bacterium]
MTEAYKVLRRADPALGAMMEAIGPLESTTRPVDFHTMVEVIVGQQLSLKAADTIFQRLCCGVECPLEGRLLPEMLIDHAPETLRLLGLSRQKSGYILDLAGKSVGGEVRFDHFEDLPDEEIIRELTAVKGIGVWTVQMILMFSLGRPDVLPVDDLGIQHGIRLLDGLSEKPTKAYMLQRAEVWRPHRSLACRYLWRIKDSGLFG